MSILTSASRNDQDIEPKEAFNEIEKNNGDSNCIILDVRTPKEYSEEHLENAKLIDFTSSSFKDEIIKLDKNKKYFLYCRSGRRSRSAANLMERYGFKNVYSINGGINKWKREQLPLQN